MSRVLDFILHDRDVFVQKPLDKLNGILIFFVLCFRDFIVLSLRTLYLTLLSFALNYIFCLIFFGNNY